MGEPRYFDMSKPLSIMIPLSRINTRSDQREHNKYNILSDHRFPSNISSVLPTSLILPKILSLFDKQMLAIEDSMATNILDEIYTTYPILPITSFDPSQSSEQGADSEGGFMRASPISFINTDQTVNLPPTEPYSSQTPEVDNTVKAIPFLLQNPNPEHAHIDPVLLPTTLPHPLLWGNPTWSNEPKIGLVERTIAPGHFAHLPFQDQIFKAESGQAVNSNGHKLRFPELLKEGAQQPQYTNCSTTTESINSWRRVGKEKAWLCNSCGRCIDVSPRSLPLTHVIRPVHENAQRRHAAATPVQNHRHAPAPELSLPRAIPTRHGPAHDPPRSSRARHGMGEIEIGPGPGMCHLRHDEREAHHVEAMCQREMALQAVLLRTPQRRRHHTGFAERRASHHLPDAEHACAPAVREPGWRRPGSKPIASARACSSNATCGSRLCLCFRA